MSFLELYIKNGFITPIPPELIFNYLFTLVKFWVISFILASMLALDYNILMFLITYVLGDYSFFKEITSMYASQMLDDEEDDTEDLDDNF